MALRIQFGSKQINFKLRFSNRKSLGITVTPDSEIIVHAPTEASIEKIKEKVIKKAPWILKQLSYFLSFDPKTPPRKFIGGETHLYLGRQYRLKIIRGKKDTVKLQGKFIEVITDEKMKVKRLVENWYVRNARNRFQIYADPFIERFIKYNVEPLEIVLRKMPSRWGSCTPTGKVILNPDLIKASKGCIEYVIIHELCHLVHRNHTKIFIDLQTKEMPDWTKWKTKLEKLLA